MREKEFDPTDENRPLFDWVIFTLIHVLIIGGIGFVGYKVYGTAMSFWVFASAAVAGLTSTYLFAKIVPGETMMKAILGLAVAANAAYLVHNGAQSIGVQLYNDAQIKKFEIGMAQAAKSTSRTVARQLGMNAKAASELERVFGDGVAVTAALLAFLELALAMIFFAIASKRVNQIRRSARSSSGETRETQPEKRFFAPPPTTAPATGKTSGNQYFPNDPKS